MLCHVKPIKDRHKGRRPRHQGDLAFEAKGLARHLTGQGQEQHKQATNLPSTLQLRCPAARLPHRDSSLGTTTQHADSSAQLCAYRLEQGSRHADGMNGYAGSRRCRSSGLLEFVDDALKSRDNLRLVDVGLLELQLQIEGFRRRPILKHERFRTPRLRLGGHFSRLLARHAG